VEEVVVMRNSRMCDLIYSDLSPNLRHRNRFFAPPPPHASIELQVFSLCLLWNGASAHTFTARLK
jgi:hypothetical protein